MKIHIELNRFIIKISLEISKNIKLNVILYNFTLLVYHNNFLSYIYNRIYIINKNNCVFYINRFG